MVGQLSEVGKVTKVRADMLGYAFTLVASMSLEKAQATGHAWTLYTSLGHLTAPLDNERATPRPFAPGN